MPAIPAGNALPERRPERAAGFRICRPRRTDHNPENETYCSFLKENDPGTVGVGGVLPSERRRMPSE